MGQRPNSKNNIFAHIPPGNYTAELLSKLASLKSLKSLDELSLKEKIQISRTPEVTLCLVADIRGFTNFMEDNSSERVDKFLTGFFDRAGGYIKDRGGQINKFLGDGFLSYFHRHKANECMDTAFDIFNYFEDLKNSFDSPKTKHFGLSVAITSGKSVIGTIGSAHYLDYTMLGRHVNRAFRLVKLSKWGQIWITDELKDDLADRFLYLPMPRVELKGMNPVTPIWVFRKMTATEIEKKFISKCSICEFCDRHDLCNISFQNGLDGNKLTIDCAQCFCSRLHPEGKCNRFQHCSINWRRGEREGELGLEPFRLGRECCEVCQFFLTCLYAFLQAKYHLNNPTSTLERVCCSHCKNVNKKIKCKNAS